MATAKNISKAAPAKRAATPAVKPEPVAKAKAAPKAAPKAAAVKPVPPLAKMPAGVSPEQRRNYVEVAAYHIAERRRFAPGNPLQDWVQAEAEIDRLIAAGLLGA